MRSGIPDGLGKLPDSSPRLTSPSVLLPFPSPCSLIERRRSGGVGDASKYLNNHTGLAWIRKGIRQ